jgi:hypothetical protein
MKNGKIYNIAQYTALYITYNGFPIGEFAVNSEFPDTVSFC